MNLRDIALTLIVAGLVPFALFEPFVGMALWTWISVMNPHRLTWGFAYELPFAMIIAVATLVSLVISPKKVSFPITPATIVLIAFLVWITVTIPFSIHVRPSLEAGSPVMKTLVMTLVGLAVVRTEKQMLIFLWIFVMSVAFFGVKGGIFAAVTGGEFRVYGPPNSHIEDNNAISVALVMMIPLMWFLSQDSKHRLVRYALIAAVLLSAAAVLASYSRGAFVAICAMVTMLAIKTRRKALFAVLLICAIPVLLTFMPDKWGERMATIRAEEVDQSTKGRFNAWWMCWNLALDRPVAGGGFAIYEPDVFARYAPDPADLHSAHSIYFQMLGEHGFVGLALYLLLALLMWRIATRVIRASTTADTLWRANLARALQVSMVGFLVGGLTVNIGYWDVYYFELVLLVALERLSIRVETIADARNSSIQPRLTSAKPGAPG
jgi:probable O-glycosylation ligase (exosortase A-associated)